MSALPDFYVTYVTSPIEKKNKQVRGSFSGNAGRNALRYLRYALRGATPTTFRAEVTHA